MRATTIVLCLLVSTGGLFSSAAAQNYQGGVRGTVRDANGVVPGVAVELTEVDTGLARTSLTNERGEFAIANVLPGTYGLRAAAQGFKVYERPGLRIGTQTFLTLD